ncbi:MAG: hypothetical protein ABR525_02220 [Candidatus Limnocylindria bacterium]
MDRRILLAIAVVIGAVLVGAGAYQAGLAQGVATAGQGGGAAVPYGYYHPYGFGFGFLGFLFPLAFILLLYAAFRGARGGGRNWGDRRGMLDDWHRRAHDDQRRPGDVNTPAPR